MVERELSCERCGNDEFDDYSLRKIACKKCRNLFDKGLLIDGLTAITHDMDEKNFSTYYCGACKAKSLCKTTTCYERYYKDSPSFFESPGVSSKPEISYEKFLVLALQRPGLILMYALSAMSAWSTSQYDKYDKLEEFLPDMFKCFSENMGNDIDFMEEFFLEGWFLTRYSPVKQITSKVQGRATFHFHDAEKEHRKERAANA